MYTHIKNNCHEIQLEVRIVLNLEHQVKSME